MIYDVTLTVVERNGRLTVLDSNGKRIGKLSKNTATPMPNPAKEELRIRTEWGVACGLMLARLSQKKARNAQTDWGRKCGVWVTSLRMRRNRNRARFAITKYLDGNASRHLVTNWDARIQLFLRQYANWYYEERNRQANPWRVWAQTVCSNLRKRKRRQSEKSAKTEERWIGDNFGSTASCESTRLCVQLHGD